MTSLRSGVKLGLMKKILITLLLASSFAYADHQSEEYSFNAFQKFEIKGSDNHYQFKSELI